MIPYNFSVVSVDGNTRIAHNGCKTFPYAIYHKGTATVTKATLPEALKYCKETYSTKFPESQKVLAKDIQCCMIVSSEGKPYGTVTEVLQNESTVQVTLRSKKTITLEPDEMITVLC